MQIKYQIQLWFHWGCSYIQTTVGSQQITSITVSKYTNIYLQVMITRHNTRLHEVLWWQGWAGGRGVCQAGGRPPQAGPAWPGRIMLGRGRQDIQVMTRIIILLFFNPGNDLQGHPGNTQLLLQQGVQTSLPQDCATRIGSPYLDICYML